MRLCAYIPGALRALAFARQGLASRTAITEDINKGAFRILRGPIAPLQLNKGVFMGILDLTKRSGELSLSFVSHTPTGTMAIADNKWSHFALAQEIFPKFNIEPKDSAHILGGRLKINERQDKWIDFSAISSSIHFGINKDSGPVYERLAALASLCRFESSIQRNDQGRPLYIKVHA